VPCIGPAARDDDSRRARDDQKTVMRRPDGLLSQLGSVPFASHVRSGRIDLKFRLARLRQKEPGKKTPRGQTIAPNLPRRQ
jgi:hypothetical protein